MDLEIRDATAADLPAICAIYAPYVAETVISFEEEPPSVDEMAARREAVLALGACFLVAVDSSSGDGGGEVVGFAYATTFRARPAYRWVVEDAVYVARQRQRRGVGRALLAALLTRLEAAGFRRVVAGISDSGDAASAALHCALGFQPVGVLPSVGFKQGRWVDVAFLQRTLGDGDRSPPPTG